MDNLNSMIKKAESGDAEAQWRLAFYMMWESGERNQDWVERAISYYERSAAQGYGDSMLELGAIYILGVGIDLNKEKALYWYNRAADMLFPKAFSCLGYEYGFHGHEDGGFVDYKAGFSYFIKGSLLKDANSVFEIAKMYYYGNYVKQDIDFAYRLFLEAQVIIDGFSLADNYEDVHLYLAEYYYKGQVIKQDIDMAKEYLEEAISGYERRIEEDQPPDFFMSKYRRSKRLLKKIEAGIIPEPPTEEEYSDELLAFMTSDMMKFSKPALPIEELEAVKAENRTIEMFDNKNFNEILEKAEEGDTESLYQAAYYLFNRFEDEPNNQSIINYALYCYHECIKQGFLSAMYNLGTIYFNGSGGVPFNKEKAYYLYLYSDVVLASSEIGEYYARGEVVEQDFEQAFLHFAKTALYGGYGSHAAFDNLARMYSEGIFVDVDKKFADYCTKRSKEFEGIFESE
ncbi:MAG: sel1 repeat family protein [Clostridiaceae bacterium]|nr:sel1 repeat family protein [Clostridiaceae bacterium]